ncbi:amidase, hydantoinase/carbamoylase family [Methylobacterium sp. 4-46]|uniref:Zn-dependent hydrolase n=1 Tax=unclassified Methylobacterium TaxID=2615210 RepID=UPI000152E6C3|nr:MULTISPECIES: Zn-dependent hydrolase [Methylobacterium]ACA16995.1 amidase, hydantoinase/carbamoylase family [Methylobacterium sp. 4-46]WFT82684.1 Zn-dependent hydrolase [Methylobacterium nodulans]
MPQAIDTDAFLRDLHALRAIGRFKTGVHRPTYSPEDMEARRWLADRLTECGLDATIDGLGTVLGRHPGPGPHLLVGSHIESQNEAGWLDGALGVVAGLALARAGLPVDVCAFADEEGHFDVGFLGSRAALGEVSEAEIDGARNRTDGTPLRAALERAGLAGRPRLRLDPARYRGFLELHIEQGTQLERAGLHLGIVTGIVAIWQYRIVVEGRQDHAGGTTMAERRDAGLTAVRLLAAIDAAFPRVCGEASTWTTGRIALDPGAPSIIPGRAEVLFQFRDVSTAVLERMEAELRALIRESNRRERCAVELVTVSRAVPAACDPGLMRALSEAAEEVCPGGWRTMPSGAGHDAQNMARAMPAAMLFVPSIGGISHHWAEDTAESDLVLGLRALDGAARRIMQGAP